MFLRNTARPPSYNSFLIYIGIANEEASPLSIGSPLFFRSSNLILFFFFCSLLSFSFSARTPGRWITRDILDSFIEDDTIARRESKWSYIYFYV